MAHNYSEITYRYVSHSKFFLNLASTDGLHGFEPCTMGIKKVHALTHKHANTPKK